MWKIKFNKNDEKKFKYRFFKILAVNSKCKIF